MKNGHASRCLPGGWGWRLAVIFACSQNLPDRALRRARAGDHAPHPAADPALVESGRARLHQMAIVAARCHLIAGRGNPRQLPGRRGRTPQRRGDSPLDHPAPRTGGALPDNFRAWHANLPLTELQREALGPICAICETVHARPDARRQGPPLKWFGGNQQVNTD